MRSERLEGGSGCAQQAGSSPGPTSGVGSPPDSLGNAYPMPFSAGTTFELTFLQFPHAQVKGGGGRGTRCEEAPALFPPRGAPPFLPAAAVLFPSTPRFLIRREA